MKGQLELSYQWIFVLLAGGTFLIMFFLLFKSCSQQGDERTQASTIKAQAAIINAAAWQTGERNRSFDASASCTGGTLTIAKGGASALITVPAFLSPQLTRSLIVTREISLSAPGTPELPFGNAVYVIDQTTHYYMLKDAAERYRMIAALVPVNVVERNDPLPGDAVVGSFDPLDGRQGRYGVSFGADDITFYVNDGDGLRPFKTVAAQGEFLQAGALIAANPETFSCTKGQLVKRASYLQSLYSDRLGALTGADCASMLSETKSYLDQTAPQLLLSPRSQEAQRLLSYQQTLHGMGCPVIG